MRKLLYLIGLGILCISCVNVKQPYLQRQNYMLHVPTPQKTRPISNRNLKVNAPEIAPQFATTAFIYRIGTLQYRTDYYNNFLSTPSDQILQITQHYLNATKMFSYVTYGHVDIPATYVLQMYITKLYADYTDRNHPKAVIAIQFVLMQHEKRQLKIILNKTIEKSILLTQKNSDALAQGWNVGLERILADLTRAMHASPLRLV